MSTQRASTSDRKELQKQSLSTGSGKGVSVTPPRAKKSSGVKTDNPLPAVEEQELKTPSANGDVQPRIAERAHELYHRRGGHHGQDLDDWFLAEQEILAEDSWEDIEP
ncbi:MAG: DUF2934 domain-containing protein [Nitrospirota bacterium]|nr:DUF2934 domain-containing protein [Nitrospirota bacterium]MDH5698871.1 DUF2934 domain-containing protein [Nitrospirota bacterium]